MLHLGIGSYTEGLRCFEMQLWWTASDLFFCYSSSQVKLLSLITELGLSRSWRWAWCLVKFRLGSCIWPGVLSMLTLRSGMWSHHHWLDLGCCYCELCSFLLMHLWVDLSAVVLCAWVVYTGCGMFLARGVLQSDLCEMLLVLVGVTTHTWVW